MRATATPKAGTALVILALSVWLPLGGRTSGAAEESGHATANPADTGTEKKIKYWKSPMNPAFISKEPGKDSMGMDLVPVYEGEEQSGPVGTVSIDPVTIQNIGVKTAVVRSTQLTREIRTVGRVSYDETTVRRVTPKIGGWIEKQHVNFPGQVVEKGESLLEIYSPELVATQEEYLLALRYRDRLGESELWDATAGANSLVEAARSRLLYWDITESQIEALRERGEVTRTMVLHAPFRGIIVEKNILEGGFVDAGQDLYKIADLSTVWVYADVYEYEAAWLSLGQDVRMTLAYEPGATYTGRVVYIYPYLQNMTRTLQVRMEFQNTQDFRLKPDMWVNVAIQSKAKSERLAVPTQAVIRTGKRDVAFLALEGGRFEPRELRLGAEAGGSFEVIEGLAEGDKVVTSAQFLINSESSLQTAIAKMLEMEPSPASQMPEQLDKAAGRTGHGGHVADESPRD